MAGKPRRTVGKEAHELDRNSINFFSLEYSTGIAETGLNIFKAETGIIAKDFIGASALGEEVNDEFNSKASTSDDGLTNQDIWVEGDASLLIHNQPKVRCLFHFMVKRNSRDRLHCCQRN